MKQHILCLNQLPLFGGLDKPDFINTCSKTAKKAVAKGEYLFRQGETASTVYLIKTGKLKLVQHTIEGREVILDVAGPGEVLGETVLFRGQDQPFSAVAMEDTNLCCVTRQQFESLIQHNPDFAVKIVSYLGQKLYDAMQKNGESAGTPVKDKVLRMLSRLADEYGRVITGETVIELAITQQELANMVGASRVAVAQVLKMFKEAGVIGRQGRYYTLITYPCEGKA